MSWDDMIVVEFYCKRIKTTPTLAWAWPQIIRVSHYLSAKCRAFDSADATDTIIKRLGES